MRQSWVVFSGKSQSSNLQFRVGNLLFVVVFDAPMMRNVFTRFMPIDGFKRGDKTQVVGPVVLKHVHFRAQVEKNAVVNPAAE
jgi:hypothetical protein